MFVAEEFAAVICRKRGIHSVTERRNKHPLAEGEVITVRVPREVAQLY
jgi:hypothetical protein